LYFGRLSDVHIGGPSSNQAASLESQMIHPIQLLPGQTLASPLAQITWFFYLGRFCRTCSCGPELIIIPTAPNSPYTNHAASFIL
jgi:hypothetical protein